MLTKKERICGCPNPNCILPVEEENESEIIENVEQDFPKIAKGCKTKKVGLTTDTISERVYESMIPGPRR